MMDFERTAKPIKEISLVPLINVVFLLLIFFLVAGTLERFDVLNVQPPIAESGEELDQGPLVVVMGAREELLFNDDLVTPGELENLLREPLKKYPGRVVTIKADARLDAPKLIAILERVRAAGGDKLTLMTQLP